MPVQDLLIIPRISEKTLNRVKQNIYTFMVPKNANKNDVATAIAAQYEVKVAAVNIVISKGKKVQSMYKGRRVQGKRSDTKKAYVTLAEGESIKLFEEEEKK